MRALSNVTAAVSSFFSKSPLPSHFQAEEQIKNGDVFEPRSSHRRVAQTIQNMTELALGGFLGGVAGACSGAATGFTSAMFPIVFLVSKAEEGSVCSWASRLGGQVGLMAGALSGVWIACDRLNRLSFAPAFLIPPAAGLFAGVAATAAGGSSATLAFSLGVDDVGTLQSIAQQVTLAAFAMGAAAVVSAGVASASKRTLI